MVFIHPPSAGPLWLTCAGWPLEILCADEELHGRFSQRYARFLQGVASAGATRVSVAGERRTLGGKDRLKVELHGDELTVSGGETAWARLDRRANVGTVVPHRSLAAVDVLIRSELTLRALAAGGCTLHAASVVINGAAHVFAGRSGAGKSTVAQHLANEGAHMLTDEFSILMPGADGRWWAHATPFWLGSPGSAPLKAVWSLGRGDARVTPVPAAARLRHLAGNLSLMMQDRALVAPSLRAVAGISAAVEGFELCYQLGQPIASLVENA